MKIWSLHVSRSTLFWWLGTWLLPTALLAATEEDPKPVLTVAANSAEVQVTPDGRECVVFGVFDRQGTSVTAEQPAELRIIDICSGRKIAERPCPVLPVTSSGGWGARRHVLTPDAQYYSYPENNRWMIVARVDDGSTIHRVDLSGLGVEAGRCAERMRISGDGTFFLAANRWSGADAWVRIEATPTPRVAARLTSTRRNNFLGFCMAGGREDGRLVAAVQRKRKWYLLWMDMDFKTLAQLPVPSNTYAVDIRMAERPLILVLGSSTKWTVLSEDNGKLFVARSGQGNAYGDPTAAILGGALSPDGRHLATVVSGRHPTLSIWSLAQGHLVREIPFPEPHCWSVRFNTSGRFLSCSASNHCYVWDVADLLDMSGAETSRAMR